MIETTKKYLIEQQDYVSVYKIGNSKMCTELLFSMNGPARDIYLYIIMNLGKNRDTISLKQAEVCDLIHISRNSFYNGINDLKDNAVISLKKHSEYWINPYFLFRGNRLAYYHQQCPDCIKIVAKKSKGSSLIATISEDEVSYGKNRTED
jgi:hypothetical protein